MHSIRYLFHETDWTGEEISSALVWPLGLIRTMPRMKVAEAEWVILERYLKDAGKRVLTAGERSECLQWVARAETKIQDEMEHFVVAESKSRFQPSKLASGADGFFGVDVDLTALERNAFNEACLCLLTGAYTASEFSSLKAAESMLVRWYHKEKDIWLDEPWGAVLQKMETLFPKRNEQPKELAFLDYLNARRIEVGHPKRIATVDDAEFTLNAIGSLLSALKGKMTPAAQSETDGNEQ